MPIQASESKEQRIAWLRNRIAAVESQLYGESGEVCDFITVNEVADSSRGVSRDDALKLLARLKNELAQLETDKGLFGMYSKPYQWKPMLGW